MISKPVSGRNKSEKLIADDPEICDICGLTIIRTNGLYTCVKCGLTKTEKILRSSAPHNNQHTTLNNNYSNNFRRMNILQNQLSNEAYTLNIYESFISQIFGQLQIQNDYLKRKILAKFLEIKPKLSRGYNSYEYLIPVLINFYCKAEVIIIKEDDLIKVAGIKKEKRKFMKIKNKLLLNVLSSEHKNYKKTKQQAYIRELIRQFVHFSFQNDKETGELFFEQSKVISEVIRKNLVSVNNEYNKAGIIGTITLNILREKFPEKFKYLSKHQICKAVYANDTTVSTHVKEIMKNYTREGTNSQELKENNEGFIKG